MRYLFLLFITCLVIGFSCTRCETENYYLNLTFRDTLGLGIQPIFERVYGLESIENYADNSTVDSIPINMSADSTIMLFELNGKVDTLAFTYRRELNVGNSGKGYCVRINSEQILDLTSFSSVILTFNSPSIIGGFNDDFTAIIRY